jgi:Tfp pilus assembly protein PilZ
VKVGIGTELMPLGEVFFDSKRSRKFVYGVHAKHLSSYGNFNDYAPAQFDRTKLGMYGAVNEKNYSLNGDLHYNNQGLHYYGWKIPTDSVDRATTAQRYQDVGGTFSFASHKKDSANLNYKVGIEYTNFGSKKPLEDSLSDWRARENFFAVNTNASYKLGKEIYAADFNIRYNGYKYGVAGDTNTSILDTGIVVNNTIINLKPTISTYLFNNRFKAKIGVDIVIDAQVKTKAHIYPVAELKYSMFNDIFIPYVGLRGGLKQTTFKSLTAENEFILPNVALRNENTAIDVYGGIKGTLSKRMSFNLSASFARVQNKALFVTDTNYSVGNKFNLLFDTLNLTTLEGSLSYQLNEKLKIDGIGRFYSYGLLNNTYAWNLPQWQAIARGSYNLFDKFLVNLDLNFEGGRKALVYAMEDGVTEENNQFAKSLGLVADINLGLEYRYNKRLSAFIQMNNLASQRYNRWYNHPVQIFQFMGGITARF